MNFNLSEEQNMLKDSIARFVRDEYDFDSRRANASSELGFNPANWQMFAELGWLSIPFDEAHGGFGGGATEVIVSYTHLRAHETPEHLVCRLLLEKK